MVKKLAIAAIVVVLVLAAGAIYAFKAFTSGVGGFDDWVVRQVVAIAETYIVPEVEFKSFDFAMPGTITLDGLELVAPDGTKVVEAGKAVVTLAEVPSRNKPIKIESVELHDATLRLIRDADGFKGLVPFVEGAAKDQSAVSEEVKLSNVLQLRRITLVNGGLYYDQGDGSPAMQLTGITTDMNIEPVTEDGRTWHTITVNAGRAPLMQLALDGKIDLDSTVMDIKSLTLGTDLSAETAKALPPQLQQLVRDHDANGRLDVSARGTIDAKNPNNSMIDADVTIANFNVAQGDYRLPIDTGTIAVSMSQGVLTGRTVAFNLLRGTLTAPELRVDTTAPGMPTNIQWKADQLELRELLRGAVPAGQEPKLAGKLNSSGSASMRLAEGMSSIAGSGKLKVRDGRLVAIPLVEALETVMSLGQGTGTSSKADIDFDLDGQGVAIEKLELETPVLAARGDGRVNYDATLDLLINAGPVEKITGALGDVGGIIGAVTDQLVKYAVNGTAGNPKVSVKPLGL
ncbi:MAG: AsmA-like C-terminal region-containing protein [Phycisphaerales bacterium]|nr:hypothetical protein [Phycisphaerales bacterium]